MPPSENEELITLYGTITRIKIRRVAFDLLHACVSIPCRSTQRSTPLMYRYIEAEEPWLR